MTQLTEMPPPPSTEQTTSVSDRRRPGRRTEVNPDLIPLLRGQQPALPALEFDETDECAAARGLCVGVLLSAPLWIGIAYLGSWLLS